MHDVILLGAGPAGMAAAHEVAQSGLAALLVDEQARPGGQIYRDVDRVAPLRGALLGRDYTAGLELTGQLAHPGITHVAGATVWQIQDQTRVAYSVGDSAHIATGRRLLIATGALERPMPLPGWTLPGVMTAGAAQILLKQSGIVARRAVLAGSGPLLYLVAAQMLRAGSPPLALVETQSSADLAAAMRQLPGALRGWRYLVKGLGLLAALKRAGVRRYPAASGIAIEAADDGTARSIRFQWRGKTHAIEADSFLLHHGVVPNTQTARSMGLDHRWAAQQAAFVPVLDDWGRSSQDRVFVAGDGAGIGGAGAAALAGRLAGLQISHDLGALSSADRDRRAAPIRRALAAERAARPFIDRAYPPYDAALLPADETIICRCEEVTAGDIRRYAKMGCDGPNQTKAFGRPGMGPCQGRFCGLTVTQLLSQAHGRPASETGYYRIRPPLKPVTLGEIAALQLPQED